MSKLTSLALGMKNKTKEKKKRHPTKPILLPKFPQNEILI